MELKNVVGKMNCGWTVTEVVPVGLDVGYCVGCNGKSYVTWRVTARAWGYDFYHGHYYNIDWDAPAKSKAQALADLYNRVSEDYASRAKYGY